MVTKFKKKPAVILKTGHVIKLHWFCLSITLTPWTFKTTKFPFTKSSGLTNLRVNIRHKAYDQINQLPLFIKCHERYSQSNFVTPQTLILYVDAKPRIEVQYPNNDFKAGSKKVKTKQWIPMLRDYSSSW